MLKQRKRRRIIKKIMLVVILLMIVCWLEFWQFKSYGRKQFQLIER